MLSVPNAASRPRFPSSPMGIGLCIARSVTRSIGLPGHRADTDSYIDSVIAAEWRFRSSPDWSIEMLRLITA